LARHFVDFLNKNKIQAKIAEKSDMYVFFEAQKKLLKLFAFKEV
jgi:ABC-type thiamine transport system substrate-binding protein